MRYSTQIKPISYIKANAAEVLERLSETSDPMIITQHGEAKAVLMDIRAYEESQETLAMLQIVALGMEDARQGRVLPAGEVLDELQAMIDEANAGRDKLAA